MQLNIDFSYKYYNYFSNCLSVGVLKDIVNACKVGQSVRELCAKADAQMAEETGKAFKKDKKVLKGKLL